MTSPGLSNSSNDSRTLRFARDAQDEDARTGRVMSQILDTEQPQLAVLNGDLITGEATERSNSSTYVDRVISPLVDHNVSWASAYGNHDNAGELCSSEVFERETEYQNSLTMEMAPDPSAGVTNYYLPIFPHNMSAEAPEAILWFFDTKGGDTCGGSEQRPTWVHQSVVDWFIRSHSQIVEEYERVIPSLAFFHIPTYAMRAFQKTGVNEDTEPGINDDVPVKHQGHTVNYTGQDIPFMKSLLQADGLLATFSGHDHGNDWCFKWNTSLPDMNLTGDGLNMCFGRRTGYGGYGDWTRGSRQILLRENVTETPVETWVRLEDGNDTARITLNSTYGQDRYMTESRGNKVFLPGMSFVYILIYLCWIGKFL